MTIFWVLGISIIIQIGSALLALLLIRKTGRTLAWILFAAIILMAACRCLSFLWLRDQPGDVLQAQLLPECLTLLISLAMMVAVFAVSSVFKQRRQNEEALQESEARFRTLFENLPIGISITDKNGNIIEVNQVSEKLLGVPRSDHILRDLQSPAWDIIKPDGSPMPAEEFPAFQVLKQNKIVENVEMGINKNDGNRIWLNVTAAPIPLEKYGALIAYMDITYLKKIEENLQKSEAQYRDLFEHSMDLICSHDLKGKLLTMNPEAVRVMGYEAQDLIGRNLRDFIIPELQDQVDHYLETICREGKAQGIMIVQPRPGERRIWEYNNILRMEGAKEPVVRGIARDITERWKIESALRKSEEKYRQLAETARDFILMLDLTGKPIYLNQAALKASGYSLEEALRMNIADVLPPESLPAMLGLLAKRLAGDDSTWLYEFEAITKSGKRIPVEICSALMKEDNKPVGLLLIARDITYRREVEEQRRKMEDQLRHVQKLESLGVLAGGIAHDFSNLLMGVLGNADLALMELSPASPVRQNLLEIEKISRRAAELCRQMLAYSGRGKFILERLSLSEVVREMAHMLEISISKKAVLRYNFSPNLPLVQVDATQIRQIIMNLITNASEAIGESSGVIAVSTGVMECDQAYLKETYLDDQLPEGPYVYLEVADSGCGMDEASRNRIFDPFFTTKFTGRGLGLAAVLGIIRGHQGAIKVTSEPGKGSTFKVLFPAVPSIAEDHEKKKVAEKASWPKGGTILLVDDEEAVRLVGKRMLERIGFEVITARDGQEAVEYFRNQGDQIQCILLDLTMPRMDGEECLRELRRIRKDVRVVLTSGFNAQEVAKRFADQGPAGFIQKPYTLTNLKEILKRVFD